MTLNEFRDLTYSEKILRIYEDGIYIGKRTAGDCKAVLYQLNNFYFEIIYSKYRLHIANIRHSESLSLVMPYLDQIDVKELIKV